MQNKAQEVLVMEKMGQAGPDVTGEALERTGSWVKQKALGLSETQRSGGLMWHY